MLDPMTLSLTAILDILRERHVPSIRRACEENTGGARQALDNLNKPFSPRYFQIKNLLMVGTLVEDEGHSFGHLSLAGARRSSGVQARRRHMGIQNLDKRGRCEGRRGWSAQQFEDIYRQDEVTVCRYPKSATRSTSNSTTTLSVTFYIAPHDKLVGRTLRFVSSQAIAGAEPAEVLLPYEVRDDVLEAELCHVFDFP